MSFVFKPDESVSDGARRIVSEEMTTAAGQLRNGADGQRDTAVHEARKSIKKVRSILRLVRSEIGDTRRIENVRLRNVGRRLSQARDAAVLIEVLDSLAADSSGLVPQRVWTSVRRRLVARKEKLQRELDMDALAERSARQLESVLVRMKRWSLGGDGFQSIAPGFENAFRNGAEGLAHAHSDRSPAAFHEWLKRVKDHWYHVRLMQDIWPGMLEAYARTLKELETLLGDDHNLTVLQDLMAAEFPKEAQALAPVIEKKQSELRERALAAGQRIYRVKPKRLKKTMNVLWDFWQHGGNCTKAADDPKEEPAQ